MSLSLKELWYAINKRRMKSPFLNSSKRERRGKIHVLLLLFKNRKEGSFGCFLFCYGLEMVMESSIILNFSLIRVNMSLKLCGYSLFLWLLSFLVVPSKESLCVGKEGTWWLYGRD